MNPWDAATWLASVLLAGSAILIFSGFLRDARQILAGQRKPEGDAKPDVDGEAPPDGR